MPRLLQTPTFRRAVKRLHREQKQALDDALKTLLVNLECGEAKVGDLAGVRVLKFRMENNQILLAYEVPDHLGDQDDVIIKLLAFGSHENFYRNLKR